MLVQTKLGFIQGETKGSVARFLGIPYAVSPSLSGPFKRSTLITSYPQTVDATYFKSKAPQPGGGSVTIINDIPQDIDCLYLNIWAPTSINSKKPVLVWIHGGAFTMGETSTKMYDGESFAQQGDIVYVSIQYRLGVFGFMDFSFLNDNTHTFDTNIGISDQITALQWIQQHIESFGGDPSQINLMGESAGATSVLCLMASPKAQGLFHKAIVQSAVVGGVLAPLHARGWAMRMIQHLHLSSQEAATLDSITKDQAIEATRELMAGFTEITPGGWPFGPVIDDLVPDYIDDAYKKGTIASIPLLIGTTKDEASVLVREKDPWLPSTEDHYNKLFTLNVHLNQKQIIANYPLFPTMATLKEMGRDMLFASGTTMVADYHANLNQTFVYRFDYETVVTKKMGIKSFHGAELMYCFNNLKCELEKLLAYETDGPQLMANWIHQTWIRFIRNGNPNDGKSTSWLPYFTEKRPVLSITLTPTIMNDPDERSRTIWGSTTLYPL